MIQLSLMDGGPVWVNPRHVVAVSQRNRDPDPPLAVLSLSDTQAVVVLNHPVDVVAAIIAADTRGDRWIGGPK